MIQEPEWGHSAQDAFRGILRAHALERGGHGVSRHRVFDPSASVEREELERLLQQGAARVVDTVDAQLEELIVAREPSRDLSGAEIHVRKGALLAGEPPERYGRWVLYPWSQLLVHLLPPAEFRELRADRNRTKITRQEQETLREKRIGIVGLSVGHAALMTLAAEGVGGRFRLADMDTLCLSNLNRLHHRVHELGLNKAVLSARDAAELDPYLDVETFEQGIGEDDIERFLVGDGDAKLDLLIEECDDLYVKVRLRERARAHGIPVIMDTSDRGLLDVERFDRDPGRPILHGLVPDLRAEKLRGLSTKDKIPYVLRILGSQTISPALASALVEVKETVSTWPQLASAVALGGALVTDAARRVLLGTFTESGRFYTDLEASIRDGAGAVAPDASAIEITACQEALASPGPVPLAAKSSSSSAAVTIEEMKYLVSNAVRAPSAGNMQPWRFRFRRGQVHAHIDFARASTFLDYRHQAGFLAVGAAIETMVIAAGAIGLDAHVHLSDHDEDPSLVAVIDFERRRSRETTLLAAVAERTTNRRKGLPRSVDGETLRALERAAGECGLQFVTDPAKLSHVAAALGAMDRVRFLSETLHAELMDEFRWTPEQVLRTRDGLDLATLHLSAADAAALRVMARWPAMARVAAQGGGRTLEKPSREHVAGCSGVGVLTIGAAEPHAHVRGGRAFQRVWLEATHRGLGFHPFGLPFVFLRLAREPSSFEPEVRARVEGLLDEHRRAFSLQPREIEIMMFRLVHAPPPTARSLRRELSDVLEIEG